MNNAATDTLSVAAQPLEDGPTRRVRKCFEQDVVSIRHAQSITRWLWIYI